MLWWQTTMWSWRTYALGRSPVASVVLVLGPSPRSRPKTCGSFKECLPISDFKPVEDPEAPGNSRGLRVSSSLFSMVFCVFFPFFPRDFRKKNSGFGSVVAKMTPKWGLIFRGWTGHDWTGLLHPFDVQRHAALQQHQICAAGWHRGTLVGISDSLMD